MKSLSNSKKFISESGINVKLFGSNLVIEKNKSEVRVFAVSGS